MTGQVEGWYEQWLRERPDLDPRAMATVGRLLRLGALIGAEIDWFAAERGFSRREGDVLMTLRRVSNSRPLDLATLARSLVLTPEHLSARIDQLERQGMLERVTLEGDAVVNCVRLTDKGRATVDGFLPAHIENEERLLSPLTDGERATLDDLLGRLIAPLELRR